MEYSVTKLTTYIKNMFASDYLLNNICVKGEISNCKYHSSGHIYFTLKDATSQIAGVMFSGQRRGLKFHLEEGQSVIVCGSVSIYERDGRYQIYAKEIELDGLGRLYQKYEELKKILELQGLFDNEHKKPVPKYADKIGIVTASTGAALQDIVNISKRRNRYVSLTLAPAIVQGSEATASIVKSIKRLDKMGLDVIIVGRGGGSIEDLWAFNEEIVARAVYECNTPIISAVGHETDTTIIDYVSDLRAPTPSAAAELAVYDLNQLTRRMNEYYESLNIKILQRITRLKARIDNYRLRLEHAGPEYKIRQYRQYLCEISSRLSNSMANVVRKKRHRLDIYIERMKGASPLNRLSKGYALISDVDDKVINSVDCIHQDDNINVSLLDGELTAVVQQVKKIDRKETYEIRRKI